MTDSRILVWFSCGAASAVAAKLAVQKYGKSDRVQVCYCDTSADEHPDNARFLADVERWIGQPVVRLSNPKYKTLEDVWLSSGFVVGPHGAKCTSELKRKVRVAYANPEDRHIFGFTADEADRIADFDERFPDMRTIWILADENIHKDDCYHILTAEGIELPAMYRMGYPHNNCIGCVKGGQGYWNKIRRDFPKVFAKRAALLRRLGVRLNSGGKLYWLDELDPDAGRDVEDPNIECGVFCSSYGELVKEQSQ